MFQKLSLFRIAAGLPGAAWQLGEYLAHSEFAPTGPTQQLATGWVPPRAEHGAMVEAVAGHWIARLAIETRSVPGDQIRKVVDELADRIEATTGRKPGKRERRDLKEEALRDLLPKAFPKLVHVPVWIEPATGLLAVGTTTDTKADHVITALVRAVPDFNVLPLNTQAHPASIMGAWLAAGEAVHDSFQLGRECELRAQSEDRAAVRYAKHSLDTDEVRQHIAHGKAVKHLALEWQGRVGFTLTDCMRLKKIAFMDVVFDGRRDEEADHFDADAAIACAELSKLIADLVEAMGGELQHEPTPPNVATANPAQFAGATDPLFDQARDLVMAPDGRASISYVQRHLRIGYNRAACLLEALELQGIVSPMQSDGARDVLQRKAAA